MNTDAATSAPLTAPPPVKQFLSTPLPKINHLIYLGLALATCYTFVGYICTIAIDDHNHPDSNSPTFLVALPFWSGVALGMRQLRLLWREGIRPIDLPIIALSHLPLVYYAPIIFQFWFQLLSGVLGALLLFHLAIPLYGLLLLCLLGSDPVVKTLQTNTSP